MVKQIRMLTRIQMCNLFGWNEFRHTKDSKKSTSYAVLGCVWFFLFLIMIGYVCGISYVYGKMGAADVIPQMLAFTISLIILIFNMLKTGHIIFQRKAFEMQMSLPVTKTAIIVSRFLTMYITDMMISVFIMIPGLIMYNVFEHTTVLFWLTGIVETLLLPLLPLTIATIIGAGITAVTAKWRHKNVIVTFFSLAIAFGVIAFNTLVNQRMSASMDEMVTKLAELMKERIGRVYPPAVWISDAIIKSDPVAFILYAGTSIGLFILLIWVLQRHFLSICSALETSYHNKEFKITNMESSSMLKALCRKEIKRYFASSVYVSNTLIGNIMAVALSIAVLVMGVDKIVQMFGMGERVIYLLPIFLGAVATMTPMSVSSISMEGKQWWIVNTLPVPKQMMRRSKVLANLIVAFPFYVISGVIMLIAVKPEPVVALWIVIVPALYIIFGAYAGLACNEMFPKFDWDNETQVVKQGRPLFLMIFITFFVAGVPLGMVFSLPEAQLDVTLGIVCIVLLIATILLKNRK